MESGKIDLDKMYIRIIPSMGYHQYPNWEKQERKKLGIPEPGFGVQVEMCMCSNGHSWDPRVMPFKNSCPWC